MTHDPRLATLEEIMAGNNPFELVTIPPFGAMERWRAETLLIGSTSGIQDVYRTIRSDAAEAAARADAEHAREALIAHVCDQITELARRFDDLEARLAEAEDRRRADEERKAAFEEEPLAEPPGTNEPSSVGLNEPEPAKIKDDEPPSELPEPSLELEDDQGGLPKELDLNPDPAPEPKGSVFPPPTALFGN